MQSFLRWRHKIGEALKERGKGERGINCEANAYRVASGKGLPTGQGQKNEGLALGRLLFSCVAELCPPQIHILNP